MKKITPFLWFSNDLREVTEFYKSVFRSFKLIELSQMEQMPVQTATFEIEGERFHAMSGGPMEVQFTHAVSFYIDCKDQAEVDNYWEKLSEGGLIEQCGWLKDKFGLSWQVIPRRLDELMRDKDKEKANRVLQAMLKMKKIIVADLEEAAEEVSL